MLRKDVGGKAPHSQVANRTGSCCVVDSVPLYDTQQVLAPQQALAWPDTHDFGRASGLGPAVETAWTRCTDDHMVVAYCALAETGTKRL